LKPKAGQLSAEDRAQLALFLLESLEPADQGDIEEAWRIEVERRLHDLENGKVQTIPGDEVFARARRRLG
jgi:putative addiction module component (TIGR02574 family)